MNTRNAFQVFDQCQLEQNLISDDSRGLKLWGHLAAIFALGEVEEGGQGRRRAPVVVQGECAGGCVCTASALCVAKYILRGM